MEEQHTDKHKQTMTNTQRYKTHTAGGGGCEEKRAALAEKRRRR